MSQKGKTIIIIISIVLLIILILCIWGIVKIVSKYSNIEPINELTNEPNSTQLIDVTKNETNTISNEIKTNQLKEENVDSQLSSDLNVVPTMNDKIAKDAAWCGTFQLVWNDMKNEVVKNDVVFEPQLEMVENLNKEDFNEKMISEDYYYKTFGLKTLELKAKIEKEIKEKFNQTSDVLDKIDWSEEALDDPNNPDYDRYIFYTMLYRKFEFLTKFDSLKKDIFGTKNKDVEYFGADENTDIKVKEQIRVLFYNSEEEFAVLVKTKTKDEVIFYKNPKGETFNEIYDNMNNMAEEYSGGSRLNNNDEFKAPKLKINELREYNELEGKPFKTAKGYGNIQKAIQTVQFSLDENGGEIKSEAVIDMVESTAVLDEPSTPRHFYVDDTFALFLREEGREKPYFASKIEDISKFQ